MTWGFYGRQAELRQPGRRIRIGSCKRSADRLPGDLAVLDGHVARFLATHRRFAGWTIEKVAIAPSIPPDVRARIQAAGHLPQDLTDLTSSR